MIFAYTLNRRTMLDTLVRLQFLLFSPKCAISLARLSSHEKIEVTRKRFWSNLAFSFEDRSFIINSMKPLVIVIHSSFNTQCIVMLYILLAYSSPEYISCANHLPGLRLQNKRFSEPPSPVEYPNARVLKAPLQNLPAPFHRNTYHHQIELSHLLSQTKRYSEPPSPVNSMVIY